jgi:TonB family protein
VQRLNQRQGFVLSAIVHLSLLMLLVSRAPSPDSAKEEAVAAVDPQSRVFIPPPALLRQLAPSRPVRPQATVPPQPKPAPTPPPPGKKDRISIGAPNTEKRNQPLLLRKDEEIPKTAPKGRPDGAPSPEPTPPAAATPEPVRTAGAGGAPEIPGAPGLRMPNGLGRDLPSGSEGSRARPGGTGPIATSARQIEERVAQAPLGMPGGIENAKKMGPLEFDPQGADFTDWINHFSKQVYENWLVPTPARFGVRGHVDFEFTVERDGTISDLRMLLSSRTVAFDRAARNALAASHLLPLPSDFGPPRVTMRVTFFYNEAPQAS